MSSFAFNRGKPEQLNNVVLRIDFGDKKEFCSHHLKLETALAASSIANAPPATTKRPNGSNRRSHTIGLGLTLRRNWNCKR